MTMWSYPGRLLLQMQGQGCHSYGFLSAGHCRGSKEQGPGRPKVTMNHRSECLEREERETMDAKDYKVTQKLPEFVLKVKSVELAKKCMLGLNDMRFIFFKVLGHLIVSL